MKATFNQDRSQLTITVDEEEQNILKQAQEEEGFDSDAYMYDLFESFIGNSEFSWIQPEICGDLTSAPMLGILGEEEDGEPEEGYLTTGPNRREKVEERWGFMMYALVSVQSELANHGKVMFLAP